MKTVHVHFRCSRDCLDAIGNAQLGENMVHLNLHRLVATPQDLRDFQIALSSLQPMKHLDFSRRKVYSAPLSRVKLASTGWSE